MALPITGLYAALLALVFLWLTIRVGAARTKSKISLGTGENTHLLEAVRGHGNYTEFVPLALIMIGILEINGAGSTLLHSLGGVLVAARIAHPLGLKMDNMMHPLRAAGMFGTLGVVLVSAGNLLWQHFS